MEHAIRRSRGAFTLLEVLVVVTLLSIAMGMTVFRLDDLTAWGRLRSAAAQIDSLVRLAQSEARISGTPRRVRFKVGGDVVTVHRPRLRSGRQEWDEGLGYNIGTHVMLKRMLSSDRTPDREAESSLRIGADGRFQAAGLVLTRDQLWVAVILRPHEEALVRVLTHEPQAATYEMLLMEIERPDHASR